MSKMHQGTPVVTDATSADAVRTVTFSEYRAAARTLAEAFYKDDVGRYSIDTPSRAHWTEQRKWKLHLSVFEYLTYAHIMNGLVTTIGEDYGCVALWLPPKTHVDSLYTLFRSGLWRLYFTLCAEGRHRMFTEFFPLLHDTKLECLGARDHDSYYLVYLGTRESARGKGLATKLVTHLLTTAVDVERKVSYLESSNPANVALYKRMGFEMAKTIELKRGHKVVRLDCMVREPREIESSKPATGEAKSEDKSKGKKGQEEEPKKRETQGPKVKRTGKVMVEIASIGTGKGVEEKGGRVEIASVASRGIASG